MNAGFIKVDRAILDWKWYKDVNTTRLFFHFLLKANWKEATFEGEKIQRGSFISSYSILSEETGLTVQNIRTAIKRLKSTGEVTVTKHAKYSVFTVNNYCKYQDGNRQTNSQLTGNQQGANNNRRIYKNNNNIYNKRPTPKERDLDFDEMFAVLTK